MYFQDWKEEETKQEELLQTEFEQILEEMEAYLNPVTQLVKTELRLNSSNFFNEPFLGVGKKLATTYAIIFFSTELSMKASNFSKTPCDFYKICTVILNPKVLLCSQWHQNRMTVI